MWLSTAYRKASHGTLAGQELADTVNKVIEKAGKTAYPYFEYSAYQLIQTYVEGLQETGNLSSPGKTAPLETILDRLEQVDLNQSFYGAKLIAILLESENENPVQTMAVGKLLKYADLAAERNLPSTALSAARSAQIYSAPGSPQENVATAKVKVLGQLPEEKLEIIEKKARSAQPSPA
jgi:hypothetical protein